MSKESDAAEDKPFDWLDIRLMIAFLSIAITLTAVAWNAGAKLNKVDVLSKMVNELKSEVDSVISTHKSRGERDRFHEHMIGLNSKSIERIELKIEK